MGYANLVILNEVKDLFILRRGGVAAESPPLRPPDRNNPSVSCANSSPYTGEPRLPRTFPVGAALRRPPLRPPITLS